MTPTPEQRETAQEVERRISDLLALYLEKYKTADDAQKAAQTRAIVVHEIADALAAGRAKTIEEAATHVLSISQFYTKDGERWMRMPNGDDKRLLDLAPHLERLYQQDISAHETIAASLRAMIPAPAAGEKE